MTIHSTAFIDPSAEMGGGVDIGPFCIVGPGVRLGTGCRLIAHVTLTGPVQVGEGNLFHPTAAVGGPPQDGRPAASDGRIEIGDGNLFREGVTVHLPKVPGGRTRIGSRCRFHYQSHVAHDNVIGDEVVLGSYATLAGHTVVEDGAWVEGLGGTHQFVTIGRKSWFRTHTKATQDVPPFMRVEGSPFEVKGVHPRWRTEALDRAFDLLWKSGLPRPDAIDRLRKDGTSEVKELVAFLQRSASGRMGRALEAGRAS